MTNESSLTERVATIEKYMQGLSKKDKAAVLAVLTDSAVIRDPYGQSEFVGTASIEQYLDDLFETWYYYEMRIDGYYPGGESQVALRWSVSGTAMNNRTADFSGISVFTFANPDKITEINTYWHLNRILERIKNE